MSFTLKQVLERIKRVEEQLVFKIISEAMQNSDKRFFACEYFIENCMKHSFMIYRHYMYQVSFEKTFATLCCFFSVQIYLYILQVFPINAYKKPYYIKHNITQWIASRLSSYWITKPAIEICSSYVPRTIYWEGYILRECSLRLSKSFKALPGIVYCNRYACCNEMLCWFKAWSVLNRGDIAVNSIHQTQTPPLANKIC